MDTRTESVQLQGQSIRNTNADNTSAGSRGRGSPIVVDNDSPLPPSGNRSRGVMQTVRSMNNKSEDYYEIAQNKAQTNENS